MFFITGRNVFFLHLIGHPGKIKLFSYLLTYLLTYLLSALSYHGRVRGAENAHQSGEAAPELVVLGSLGSGKSTFQKSPFGLNEIFFVH